jgi:branched-chain amino acid aminotransferase
MAKDDAAKRWVYLDGEWVAAEAATVSVFDHGLLYGDGVFEGIRAYGGRVFALEAHVRRLFESARSIQLDIGVGEGEMADIIRRAVERNGLGDAYIRVVVTRGRGDLGLDPRKCPRPTLFVIADAIALYPASLYEEGLTAVTVSVRRTAVDALSPRVKSLNYLNNILAKLAAANAGKAEAILLGPEGYPIEATGENLFIVRRGRLLTPPVYLGVLEGITRATVLDLARAQGMPAAEEPFTLHDLYVADECFLTGTAAEIVPVVEVDGRRIGDGRPGPVTRGLTRAFRAHVGAAAVVEG